MIAVTPFFYRITPPITLFFYFSFFFFCSAMLRDCREKSLAGSARCTPLSLTDAHGSRSSTSCANLPCIAPLRRVELLDATESGSHASSINDVAAATSLSTSLSGASDFYPHPNDPLDGATLLPAATTPTSAGRLTPTAAMGLARAPVALHTRSSPTIRSPPHPPLQTTRGRQEKNAMQAPPPPSPPSPPPPPPLSPPLPLRLSSRSPVTAAPLVAARPRFAYPPSPPSPPQPHGTSTTLFSEAHARQPTSLAPFLEVTCNAENGEVKETDKEGKEEDGVDDEGTQEQQRLYSRLSSMPSSALSPALEDPAAALFPVSGTASAPVSFYRPRMHGGGHHHRLPPPSPHPPTGGAERSCESRMPTPLPLQQFTSPEITHGGVERGSTNEMTDTARCHSSSNDRNSTNTARGSSADGGESDDSLSCNPSEDDKGEEDDKNEEDTLSSSDFTRSSELGMDNLFYRVMEAKRREQHRKEEAAAVPALPVKTASCALPHAPSVNLFNTCCCNRAPRSASTAPLLTASLPPPRQQRMSAGECVDTSTAVSTVSFDPLSLRVTTPATLQDFLVSPPGTPRRRATVQASPAKGRIDVPTLPRRSDEAQLAPRQMMQNFSFGGGSSSSLSSGLVERVPLAAASALGLSSRADVTPVSPSHAKRAAGAEENSREKFTALRPLPSPREPPLHSTSEASKVEALTLFRTVKPIEPSTIELPSCDSLTSSSDSPNSSRSLSESSSLSDTYCQLRTRSYAHVQQHEDNVTGAQWVSTLIEVEELPSEVQRAVSILGGVTSSMADARTDKAHASFTQILEKEVAGSRRILPSPPPPPQQQQQQPQPPSQRMSSLFTTAWAELSTGAATSPISPRAVLTPPPLPALAVISSVTTPVKNGCHTSAPPSRLTGRDLLFSSSPHGDSPLGDIAPPSGGALPEDQHSSSSLTSLPVHVRPPGDEVGAAFSHTAGVTDFGKPENGTAATTYARFSTTTASVTTGGGAAPSLFDAFKVRVIDVRAVAAVHAAPAVAKSSPLTSATPPQPPPSLSVAVPLSAAAGASPLDVEGSGASSVVVVSALASSLTSTLTSSSASHTTHLPSSFTDASDDAAARMSSKDQPRSGGGEVASILAASPPAAGLVTAADTHAAAGEGSDCLAVIADLSNTVDGGQQQRR